MSLLAVAEDGENGGSTFDGTKIRRNRSWLFYDTVNNNNNSNNNNNNNDKNSNNNNNKHNEGGRNNKKQSRRVVSLDSSLPARREGHNHIMSPQVRSFSSGSMSVGSGASTVMQRLDFEIIDLGNTPLSSLRSCSEFNRYNSLNGNKSKPPDVGISPRRSWFSKLFSWGKKKSAMKIKTNRLNADEKRFMMENLRPTMDSDANSMYDIGADALKSNPSVSSSTFNSSSTIDSTNIKPIDKPIDYRESNISEYRHASTTTISTASTAACNSNNFNANNNNNNSNAARQHSQSLTGTQRNSSGWQRSTITSVSSSTSKSHHYADTEDPYLSSSVNESLLYESTSLALDMLFGLGGSRNSSHRRRRRQQRRSYNSSNNSNGDEAERKRRQRPMEIELKTITRDPALDYDYEYDDFSHNHMLGSSGAGQGQSQSRGLGADDASFFSEEFNRDPDLPYFPRMSSYNSQTSRGTGTGTGTGTRTTSSFGDDYNDLPHTMLYGNHHNIDYGALGSSESFSMLSATTMAALTMDSTNLMANVTQQSQRVSFSIPNLGVDFGNHDTITAAGDILLDAAIMAIDPLTQLPFATSDATANSSSVYPAGSALTANSTSASSPTSFSPSSSSSSPFSSLASTAYTLAAHDPCKLATVAYRRVVRKLAVFSARYLLFNEAGDRDAFYDRIRVEPFGSGAYLRGLLSTGFIGMVFTAYNFAMWPHIAGLQSAHPVTVFFERLVFALSTAQLALHLGLLPVRVALHWHCWEASRSLDSESAVASLRLMVHSDHWLCNRGFGRILDATSLACLIMVEAYLWLCPADDVLRGMLVSLAATHLLGFLVRVAVSTVFAVSSHDPDVLNEARRRGLSRPDLEALPTFVYTHIEEVNHQVNCPICLCNFEMGEMLIPLPCDKKKHSFHAACIRQWLQRQNSCPLCQKMV